MRHTPFMTYQLDDSLGEADQVLRLMDKVRPDGPIPEEPVPETPNASGSG